jgi:hypothetical protein
MQFEASKDTKNTSIHSDWRARRQKEDKRSDGTVENSAD